MSNIIDQCVAQGVPFAREYGGLLDNRSFGGAQVSRTYAWPDGPATPVGSLSSARAPDSHRQVKMFPPTEMLDLVVVNGRARGITPVTCDGQNRIVCG